MFFFLLDFHFVTGSRFFGRVCAIVFFRSHLPSIFHCQFDGEKGKEENTFGFLNVFLSRNRCVIFSIKTDFTFILLYSVGVIGFII